MSRWVVGVCALLAGCGGGSASARLAFSQADANALTAYAPSTFRMKLIAAYLAEDIDPTTYNNIGQTSMFYVNPVCGDDIMHCDVSPGAAEDGAPMAHIVEDFFDFSPGTDVNAALNAQANTIAADSYRYVRLEFCKWNRGQAPNIEWGGTFGADTVTDAEMVQNSCVSNSARLDPPLVLADGDAAVVTLDYSLAGTVTTSGAGGSGGPSCTTVNGTAYCFQVPTFTPSAHLE